MNAIFSECVNLYDWDCLPDKNTLPSSYIAGNKCDKNKEFPSVQNVKPFSHSKNGVLHFMCLVMI